MVLLCLGEEVVFWHIYSIAILLEEGDVVIERYDACCCTIAEYAASVAQTQELVEW